MNNNEEKDYHNNKNPKTKFAIKVTEDVIYSLLFISKTSNRSYNSETFIAASSATFHMVKLEYNMTNLKDTKTRVTLGDSIPIISKNVAIGRAIIKKMENSTVWSYTIWL